MGFRDRPFLSVPGYRATSDCSALQPPSEIFVSFPQALCKGLSLNCEDIQAVATLQGGAGGGRGRAGVPHTLDCLRAVLVEEAVWARRVPREPCTAVGPEPR